MKDAPISPGDSGGAAPVKQVQNPAKINAFQFMMSSRNKSIGRNSPGREAPLPLSDSADANLTKQELKSRKSKLESWAEQKGAAKRKREYEEIGNCINHKLEKRGKKLRKMLSVESHSDDEVVTKRNKKRAVIETDSENSNEAKERIGKGKSHRLSLSKSETTVEEEVTVKLTPKAVKSWKFKIKLCMSENVVSEDAVSKERDESEIAPSQSEIKPELTPENVISTESEIKPELTPENVLSTESEKTSENELPVSDECILVTNGNSEKEEANDGRRVLRVRKPKPIISDESESDEETIKDKKKKKEKKNLKVAPVFLKAIPRPKLDPKVVEARRQFLLSGVPSSVKKEMERQQCIEEVDFDVFPTVSHVQQKSPDNSFWDLPKVDLTLKNLEIEKIETEPFSKKLLTVENLEIREELPILSKVKNVKKLIREIKSQNPDYPVYKIFNSIYKGGYRSEENIEKKKPIPKRRGRPKKNSLDKSAEIVNPPPIRIEESNVDAMWTEKYKAKSSADIIGNHSSVSLLKEWLTNWLNTTTLKKKKNSDSESEFDVTDSDSRDSTKVYGNTVILKGPVGSGKTAAIYAVCNELGFNVLEVNASSKRTGKRLLQELHEATQSHQVCKKQNIFVKEEKKAPKMCVLLVEDVDVVFEQDEGFTAALSQIITTTKRPVILTASDEPSGSIQKIINDHQIIKFSPFSPILTVWLQIVCLVEGLYLNPRSLEELLSYNRGDIRRTLLQLQLYVNSGGQLKQNKNNNEIRINTENVIKMEDDNSNLSDSKVDEPSTETLHGDCLDSCHPVKNYKSFSLPHCNNFEIIWWNLPALLNLPDADLRLDRTAQKEKIKALSDCYDSLTFADVMSGKNQFHESLERRWRTKTKDSLALDPNSTIYQDFDFCHEMARAVLSGGLKLYKDKYEEGHCGLNMAVPTSLQRRWRSKRLSCEDKLLDAVPVSDFLARKSLALDYLPTLRNMGRSEAQRATLNTKRGNRFYNYLRNLGVHVGDSTFDVFNQL